MTRFRELRLQRGLSQEQLCRQYNEKYNRKYTTAAMSLIEHDKRSPELGALLDFADFYDVSLDYLLGRDLSGKATNDFSVGSQTRSWQISEQLRNMIKGLNHMQNNHTVENDKSQPYNQEKSTYTNEAEENLGMLICLLQQSMKMARRVEKKGKGWYQY